MRAFAQIFPKVLPLFTLHKKNYGQVFPEIVEGAPKSVNKIGADGAYDTAEVYRIADQRGITPCSPPRENAVLDKTSRDYMEARDDAIRIKGKSC